MPSDVLESTTEVRRGMENLVVDTTSISWVDGANGALYYRGINIAELAAHAGFEETAYLLMCGSLPTAKQLSAFTWKLREMTPLPEKILRIVQELPRSSHPLASLQVALAALGCLQPGRQYSKEESEFETSMRIVAQTPVILAAAYRHHFDMPFIAPRPDLNHAENFMFMLTGKIPSRRHARFMEVALVVHMDHGFNPSTFTARAVASTLTGMYAATSAAVGALAGPLHGGASEQVVEMIQDIKEFATIRQFVETVIANHGKVMGMGHRVYKSTDPRARIFEDMLEQLTTTSDPDEPLFVLRALQKEARAHFEELGKPIYVNVDFWSGAVYEKLGIHPILYSAIFAAGRIVGWTSHILELLQNNRLYRPRSLYTGEINVPYVPLESRSSH